MSKKSYAKTIIDLNILHPDAIKKNIEIYLGKNISEEISNTVLFNVLDKMSLKPVVEELTNETEDFFTETELKTIIKYMKYFALNSKPKVIEFYKELIECIQSETKPYEKDD